MLIELPTADEIDDLAISTPELSVRKFEYDRRKTEADLNYTPCKGQMILVVRGEQGTLIVKRGGAKSWSLPSAPIMTYEQIADAPRRVAKELCGLSLRSYDLAALYDVVWHFKDVTIKRLHVIYSAVTDDAECTQEAKGGFDETAFRAELPDSLLDDELDRNALSDCSEK
jgi:ADP-ribose pyrophosphatase YjhB (NUDIX family)